MREHPNIRYRLRCLRRLESNPEITAASIALLLDITPNNARATIYRLRKQEDGRP